ncbi:MAG TPA: peroxidase family protein, partial [Gemmataceae bacterium]|nr:peroxidase family protein [Gemmataceae bacterium]
MNRTSWKRLLDRKPKPWRRQGCRPSFELLEARCLLSDFRTITGYGNNLANPTWGQSGTDLLRVSPIAYADGISAPSTPNTLNPRLISNNLSNQSDPIFSGND